MKPKFRKEDTSWNDRLGVYSLKTVYLEGYRTVQLRKGLRTGRSRGQAYSSATLGANVGHSLLLAVEFARAVRDKTGVPQEVIQMLRVRDNTAFWITVDAGEAPPKGDRYSGNLCEIRRWKIRQ